MTTEHKPHSVFSDVRDALAAPRGDAGVEARMLALDSVQRLEEQLEAVQQKLDAATTMLAEAEKIVPGVITTAGRMALGMNDRERADALRVVRERRDENARLIEQLESAQAALREIVNRASGSSDVFAGHAARIARDALDSNPAFVPGDSLSPDPNSEQTPATSHPAFLERKTGDYPPVVDDLRDEPDPASEPESA